MGQVHLRFQEMNRNEAGSRGIADRSGLRRTRADHVARRTGNASSAMLSPTLRNTPLRLALKYVEPSVACPPMPVRS